MENQVSRRDFIKIGVAAAAVGTIAPKLLAQQAKDGAGADEKKEAPKLEYRTLGKTGLKVTTVSLGCMVTPKEIIARAADMGVNWLDTAHSYKKGNNEVEVGDVVKGRRDKFYICTKVHYGSDEQFNADLDLSLKRLGTDHVELLLLHGISSSDGVKNPEAIASLERAKKDGKTKFIGVSTHQSMPAVINALVETKKYDVVLTAYNFQSADPETAPGKALKEAVAKAAEAGIGVIAMKTQRGGSRNASKTMPPQAALKWVLEDKNITCAIPGAREMPQFEENFAVMGARLGYLERRRLELYAEATASSYCTGCGECTGTCPNGVSIPGVRRSAMYLDGYDERELAKNTYRDLLVNAARCDECETCTAKCIYGVAIQPIMRDAHSRLA